MNGEPTRRIELAQVVAASPEAVFDAWSSAEQVARWICPDPTARVVADNDLQPGGSWSVRMETSAGAFTAFGAYREIARPLRMAFTWDWREPPQAMGVDTTVTVEFAAVEGGTKVLLSHCGFPSDEAAKGHEVGWKLALERLAASCGTW